MLENCRIESNKITDIENQYRLRKLTNRILDIIQNSGIENLRKEEIEYICECIVNVSISKYHMIREIDEYIMSECNNGCCDVK